MTSQTDIVAPSLAGPCIDERFTAVSMDGDRPIGLVEDGDDVREEPIPSRRPHRLEAFLRTLLLFPVVMRVGVGIGPRLSMARAMRAWGV